MLYIDKQRWSSRREQDKDGRIDAELKLRKYNLEASHVASPRDTLTTLRRHKFISTSHFATTDIFASPEAAERLIAVAILLYICP
jgi:hypothetical protein